MPTESSIESIGRSPFLPNTKMNVTSIATMEDHSHLHLSPQLSKYHKHHHHHHHNHHNHHHQEDILPKTLNPS